MNRNAANYAPLTPVSFLSARPSSTLTSPGSSRERSFTYRVRERARLLASVLARAAWAVATPSHHRPNVPALLEALTRCPGWARCSTAQLPALRGHDRLLSSSHGGAKVLITDREFSPVVSQRSRALGARSSWWTSTIRWRPGDRLGATDYESWIATGDPAFELPGPRTMDAAALLTPRHDGNPKVSCTTTRRLPQRARQRARLCLTRARIPVAALFSLQRLDLPGRDRGGGTPCACASRSGADLSRIARYRVTHLACAHRAQHAGARPESVKRASSIASVATVVPRHLRR